MRYVKLIVQTLINGNIVFIEMHFEKLCSKNCATQWLTSHNICYWTFFLDSNSTFVDTLQYTNHLTPVKLYASTKLCSQTWRF